MSSEPVPQAVIDELERVLVNLDKSNPLSFRYRALFSLNALAKKGDKRAVDAIYKAFIDDSELLKHEMAYVMGQSGQQYAVQPLINIVNDLDQQVMVRHEAAEALGALGFTESLPVLEKYYKEDPLAPIRETCELAIARIQWKNGLDKNNEKITPSMYDSVVDPAPPMPDHEQDVKSEVAKLRSEIVDQNLPLFYRYRVMFRLRNIGNEEAVLALTDGFKDPSPLFRHEIAFVFGQMIAPASVPALIKVLENTEEVPMVRHEAAEALGGIANDECLPVLKKFSKDDVRVVAESCIVALDMIEYEKSGDMEYAYIPKVSA
ncbi:Deoxyhypusine hydroxylase [Schizosaccharomyces pombe]|uniref:Deoxyhypusine hydroxylase n=1 Tax=Schizosaccharomyces pombe (strain 972 / ATCC 24843) TaxID=284812 RepID=DOHH_SCHPO|nr:putative deoxyhypusine hydroxylase [Schizosaccharomyces pombe]Q9P6K9.1 RecName: Full=Deoxyhypusine hydroxylase; Short=DOHH; AltName: Full=Deoxyhypusine dioxygenase; AltName: Full=Deoxyhypusine monooxygenase [Schizosaccharomyces pombe 972h-]CAB90789.1 deoxyhypusine hydroxylase (predicted) [Schizosaccharomyces pombe]|eukprot:NP_594654.1 putative deoxyhypusine hydroxylase [Schizosaccharomyces pombe]